MLARSSSGVSNHLEKRLDVHFSFHIVSALQRHERCEQAILRNRHVFHLFLYVGFFLASFFKREKNGVKYPEIRKLIGTSVPCILLCIGIFVFWYPQVWNCPSCKQVNLYEDNRGEGDYSTRVRSQWCGKCGRVESHPKLYISDKPFYSH